MSQPDFDLVGEVYAVLARRDFAALLDMLDPEIEWPDAGVRPLERCRGHEQVLAAVLERILDERRACELDPEQFLAAGGQIVVLGHQRCRSRASGRRYAVPFAHVWTLREGLVVRFRAYADRPQLRAADAAGAAGAR
jgi:ketosteroid isomerase-like protein